MPLLGDRLEARLLDSFVGIFFPVSAGIGMPIKGLKHTAHRTSHAFIDVPVLLGIVLPW